MSDDTPPDEALAGALLRGDLEFASGQLAALREAGCQDDVFDWAEHQVLVNQGRTDDAERLRPQLVSGDTLLDFESSLGLLPHMADRRWTHDGKGPAQLSANTLRLVALGDVSSVYEGLVAELNNVVGTWIEAVVRCGSGGEDSCRIELADGSARETLVINSGSLALLSTGTGVRFHAMAEHLYGLWVCGQTSRLYADGQLILESRGLPATSSRAVRFGSFATGADAESSWRMLTVSRGNDRAVPVALPRPWPISWWTRAIDDAITEGDTGSAAAYLQQARLVHPDVSELRLRLRDFLFDRSAAELPPSVVRRLIASLPAADRADLAERSGIVPLGEPLLSAVKVGIRFKAGVGGERSIRQLALGPLRRSGDRARYFWAIRGVDLDVRAGDLVAIVGRNGAGKTTLLNALADLIEPDEGEVQTAGRPLLLSAGSGFLPGLTGRDNVLLSGLYLGLTRREVRERFDEIVEFAELWDAIDRPVRTYSAGMKSRLQFAIATTVDPELLLLDELLGAGDAAFTEKAETRMQQQLRRSKAVVVATHDMHFVRTQCTSALVLEAGHVLFQGAAEAAVVAYHDLLAVKPKRVDRVAG